MYKLIETHNALLRLTENTIRRGLMDKINHEGRMIAIKGGRGVGKTTFLLNYGRERYGTTRKCLYININNLFIASNGLYHFIERFNKLGGKVLLLDQIHKYPNWDIEIKKAYNDFKDIKIVFTGSSILRIRNNPALVGIVDMYNLSGFSFREYLEIETGHNFPTYTFDEIINNHKDIAEDILNKVHPLAYFEDYLKYGYYPTYISKGSYIDSLLKNINLTLEFDIPYINQIDLNCLIKLKKLLFYIANGPNSNINVSKLSSATGIARATVLNYIYYMRDARLITIIQEPDEEDSSSKKPKRIFTQNPNLLHSICLENIAKGTVINSFFLSQLFMETQINYTKEADFLINGKYKVNIVGENDIIKSKKNIIRFKDMLEKGKGNEIPLWLAGFVY